MVFLKKKEKKKFFFQNVLFQDKLEINEQKVMFFGNFEQLHEFFLKKKENLFFQDKLEINEQKIMFFFSEKAIRIFQGLHGFFKKKLLKFSSSCMGFSQKKRKDKTFLSKHFISRRT